MNKLKQTVAVAMFALAAAMQVPAQAEMRQVNADTTAEYLLAHQKPNGAFGPLDQYYTDLWWNVDAVESLALLGQQVPHPDRCFENGSGGPCRMPYEIAHRLARLQKALGRLPEAPAGRHRMVFRDHSQNGRTLNPDRYFKFTPENSVYGSINDLYHLVCVAAMYNYRLEQDSVQEAAQYIASIRRDDGSYLGHVVHTVQAVLTLQKLGVEVPGASETAEFLRSCQTANGGFRWHPADTSPSNKPDVWYSRMAVQALAALGSEPRDREGCVNWLNSLQNSDGGFGDRPGWRSRLSSTRDALLALKTLSGSARSGIAAKQMLPPEAVEPLSIEGMNFYTASHKTPHGKEHMVDSVHEWGFDLIGVNPGPGSPRPGEDGLARTYAAQQGYDLEIVLCPEFGSFRVDKLGWPNADHCCNFLIRPDLTEQQVDIVWQAIADGGRGSDQSLPWAEFRHRTIKPMLKIGTLIYPEGDHGRVNAYLCYDDGLNGGPGYNAFQAERYGTSIIRFAPYRTRWLGHHAFLSDQDAHGTIDQLKWCMHRGRSLFIAKDNSFASYLDAALNGRLVSVVRDEGAPDGVVLYGPAETVAAAREHIDRWRWWPSAAEVRKAMYAETYEIPDEWKNLPGLMEKPWSTWLLKHDFANSGVQEKWYAEEADETGWTRVPVPAFWSETKAGGHTGYTWYRTAFRLPAENRGRAIRLLFGAVDEQAWVYVNGRPVGAHSVESEGKDIGKLWNVPFTIDVMPEALSYGESNVLAIRVHNVGGFGGIWRPILMQVLDEQE